jgi:hypothetical protein
MGFGISLRWSCGNKTQKAQANGNEPEGTPYLPVSVSAISSHLHQVPTAPQVSLPKSQPIQRSRIVSPGKYHHAEVPAEMQVPSPNQYLGVTYQYGCKTDHHDKDWGFETYGAGTVPPALPSGGRTFLPVRARAASSFTHGTGIASQAQTLTFAPRKERHTRALEANGCFSKTFV